MKKFLNHHSLQLVSTLLVIFFTFLLAVYSVNSNSETQLVEGGSVTSKNGSPGTVPYITFRNKTGGENVTKFYGGERGTVSAGYCNHSGTSLKTLKPIAEKMPFYIPEDIIRLDSIKEIDIEEFWEDMKRTQKGRYPTLYMHGFNIDFEKGCRRAAMFQKSYDMNGQLVFFSWPSDGILTNYTHDEADVYWSAEPLRQTLGDMITHFGEGNINIVAHSLGTRGVMFALVMLAQAEHGDKPLLNQVVLIAPDIDAGVFEQYLPLIRPLAKKITIYVSGNDNPLMLSRQLHGYPRLGESGAHLVDLTGIDIIDISKISMRTPSGHVYHLYHNVVINDLDHLLNKNQSASQRNSLKQTSNNYWQL